MCIRDRNIGARGLRAVMEGILTKIMFDIPSDPTVKKVVVTPACVNGECGPETVSYTHLDVYKRQG